MYHIKLTDYVPEPHPASSDYLVCAHYYAAWKKGAAGLHNGFDDLHDYPERTPLAGYYDEDDPRYTDWEIKWALEHGINCFIHCWYRYKENVGKPVVREALRCAHALHDGFFNARYEKMMKFAIMFETSPRWGSTTKEDMLQNLMPYWMETYFKRGNYLIIDNKPVLFSFAWQEMAKALGTPEEQKAVFDSCRDYCRACGFDGMIFAVHENRIDPALQDEIVARGYDFMFTYNFCYQGENNPPEQDVLSAINNYYTKQIANYPKSYIPTVSCFLDTEPRRSPRWIEQGYHFDRLKVWYLSPEQGYRAHLRHCKQLAEDLPADNAGRRIIMIDNWNEWDEGHYVAPSHRFGFQYLQAIREELTHRDNLPDYRMPQDIGLSDFNHSWEEPDLSDVCRKRFGL